MWRITNTLILQLNQKNPTAMFTILQLNHKNPTAMFAILQLNQKNPTEILLRNKRISTAKIIEFLLHSK